MSKTFSNHGTRGSSRGTSRRWLNLAVGLGVSAILLGSCAVGPNYKRPAINAPSNFRDATEAATNTVADLPWWQVFQDETLQGLIRTALTNNYDLRIAIARVEQAQAIALQSRLAFFPQLNYQASANRGRNAVNGNALFNHGAITNTFLIEGPASAIERSRPGAISGQPGSPARCEDFADQPGGPKLFSIAGAGPGTRDCAAHDQLLCREPEDIRR